MTVSHDPHSSAAENKSIGIIVLAAGASERMRQPKQLLQFGGNSLLRRAAQTAVESVFEPVVVVLGANFDKTRAEIGDLKVEIVFNPDWPGGLSSSIKIGLEKLLQISPNTAAVMLMLADQPLVTSIHLDLFAERFEHSKNPIIAAEYQSTTGVPALFAREVFLELNELSGDKGAKMLLEKHLTKLSTILLPEAAFDIDTPHDFEKLKQ
jgi:molybdenum cofactor cytidylyltransferase